MIEEKINQYSALKSHIDLQDTARQTRIGVILARIEEISALSDEQKDLIAEQQGIINGINESHDNSNALILEQIDHLSAEIKEEIVLNRETAVGDYHQFVFSKGR